MKASVATTAGLSAQRSLPKAAIEIALNTLAEASAAELSKQHNPQGFNQQKSVAKGGGNVARVAREQLESQLGRTIISKEKASDYILPTPDFEEPIAE